VILPKIRDPRFITVRRGGTLQDDDHRLLAMWAVDCAEHALRHFEQERPPDDRPRRAIDFGRAWPRAEITWADARTAAGHANAAARDLRGSARHAATRPARLRRSAMSRPTNSVPRPTRSGRPGQQRLKAKARRPAAWSASGSVPNSPTRSENSCSTTSDCATSCAGSRSTADAARSRPHAPHPEYAADAHQRGKLSRAAEIKHQGSAEKREVPAAWRRRRDCMTMQRRCIVIRR